MGVVTIRCTWRRGPCASYRRRSSGMPQLGDDALEGGVLAQKAGILRLRGSERFTVVRQRLVPCTHRLRELCRDVPLVRALHPLQRRDDLGYRGGVLRLHILVLDRGGRAYGPRIASDGGRRDSGRRGACQSRRSDSTENP